MWPGGEQRPIGRSAATGRERSAGDQRGPGGDSRLDALLPFGGLLQPPLAGGGGRFRLGGRGLFLRWRCKSAIVQLSKPVVQKI